MSDSPRVPEDLAALLRRVQSGDEDALAALVEHYAGTLRRAARASLGPAMRPHLDSLDLVQSVHRILLQGLRQNKFEFREHDRVLSLALTLIRRRVARHWRQLKTQAGTDRGGDPSLSQVPDPSARGQDDPGEGVVVNEQFERLVEGLDDLDRRLLELRLEGHSTADAARELGVDAGLLRVRLGRLRKRLRQEGVLTEWV